MAIREEDGVEVVPPQLVVCVPPVQQRSGINDCGVFAIAFKFAVHLLLGDKLEAAKFDQNQNEATSPDLSEGEKIFTFPKEAKVLVQISTFPLLGD